MQGTARDPRDFVFSVTNEKETHLIVLGSDGAIKFQRRLPFPAIDFQPHRLAGGRTYYSYLRVERSHFDLNTEGRVTILDENFAEVETISEILDGHQFEYLGRNHYRAIYYEQEVLKSGICQVNQYVREKRAGKTIFSVSARDLLRAELIPRLSQWKRHLGKRCIEFFHLNTFRRLDSDRWLIGLGNDGYVLWSAKRKAPIWSFGHLLDRFGLPEEFQSGLQHDGQFDPKQGVLTFLDNGRANRKFRLLEFTLNEKKLELQAGRVLFFGDFGSESYGNFVLPLPGKTVITIAPGEKRDLNPQVPDIFEVDAGQMGFRIHVGNPTYMVHRAYRH